MLGSWCSGQHYHLSRLLTVYSAVCWGHDVVVSSTACHAFLLSTALYAGVMMKWSALPPVTPSYCLQRCMLGSCVVVSTTACHAFLLSTALYAGVMMKWSALPPVTPSYRLQRCMPGSWCSGQHYRLSRLPTVYSAVCWGHDVVVSTTACHAFLQRCMHGSWCSGQHYRLSRLPTALYAGVMM